VTGQQREALRRAFEVEQRVANLKRERDALGRQVADLFAEGRDARGLLAKRRRVIRELYDARAEHAELLRLAGQEVA